jgi:hypothetical protein
VGDDVGVGGVELERRLRVQAEPELLGFHRWQGEASEFRSIWMWCDALDRAKRCRFIDGRWAACLLKSDSRSQVRNSAESGNTVLSLGKKSIQGKSRRI